MKWHKTLIAGELTRLSFAFCVIFLISVAVCIELEVLSLSKISIIVLFIYFMSVIAVIFQRWDFYKYAIGEKELYVYNRNGDYEMIEFNNLTVKVVKKFHSFNVVFIMKNRKMYDVYVGRDSEEWEMLRTLLELG